MFRSIWFIVACFGIGSTALGLAPPSITRAAPAPTSCGS